MQPVGLLSYTKMGWILKKQYIQFIGDYKFNSLFTIGGNAKDDLWKVFSLLMSALVLPLAGWVWNTNVKVAELQNDLGDAESVISVLVNKKDQYEAKEVELASQIIGIEKDIEYMKGSLGRIEELVTRRDK